MAACRSRFHVDRWWHWLAGFVAFVWVAWRSGSDPRRLAYPCQRMASPLAAQWILAVTALVAGSQLARRLTRVSPVVMIALGVVWLLVSVAPLTRSMPGEQVSLPVWEVDDPVSILYVLDSLPPTSGSLAAGDTSVPDSHLVDPAIDSIFAMLAHDSIYLHRTAQQPEGLVGAADVVIIKGNFQWTSRNTTSTDRIKGLIWQILQHPDGFTGEILICDNTQDVGTGINQLDNNSEDPLQSIIDVASTFAAKGYPVYVLDWRIIWNWVTEEYADGNYIDGYVYDSLTKITYPKFRTPSGNHLVSLRHGVWDSVLAVYDTTRLSIFDMPVPKAHVMAGATVAVKNWIGVVTTAYSAQRYGSWDAMHYSWFWSPYALVARVMVETWPELTIVDAAWVSGVNPNVLDDTTNTNALVVSTDPVAASWYAAKFILTPNARTPGQCDPDNPSGRYHNTLDNWNAYLRDSLGLPCSRDSAEISVYDRELLAPPILVGDANYDGTITSADIIYLVNHVFKGGPPPQPEDAAGDADCSGLVTSADIIFMVNYVFKGGPAPSC